MTDEVKLNGAEEEQKASSSGALSIINADDLNKESLSLINQIIAEADLEKTKDLTHLFNINQNKKTMIRVDKLSNLYDNVVEQFKKRVLERPDEMSNKELMDALKLIQDIIERGQKQMEGVDQTPLIQINQQTNSVNIGEAPATLTRESRDKVKNAVMALLKDINKNVENSSTSNTDEIINVEAVEND